MSLGVPSLNFTHRWCEVDGRFYTTNASNCVIRVLLSQQSSPFLGWHCFPPLGEGSRKCDLNIAYSRCFLSLGASGWASKNCTENKKQMENIFIATWNVRTLQDGKKNIERRTALIARVLKQKNIGIAALSETRLADYGQLQEMDGGYTFFWKGKLREAKREAGVGFAIRNDLVKRLVSLPTGINERLMSLRVCIGKNKYATIFSCYAPTMHSNDIAKEEFYLTLRSQLRHVPIHDKLLLLGDFNARVGSDTSVWGDVIGKHGVGRANSNGHLLLSLCNEFGLLVTNTIFQLPTRCKISWRHPRSNHYHLLDYVITRSSMRNDVKITRSFAIGECWSDHRLIRSKMRFTIHNPIRNNRIKPLPKIDVTKLRNRDNVTKLQAVCDNKLLLIPENADVESVWSTLKNVIFESSCEILGYVKRKHRDWFDSNDPNISPLLDNMHKCHHQWMLDKDNVAKRDKFKKAKNACQSQLRQMKQAWWEKKAQELQEAADKCDFKAFYQNLKGVFGPMSNGPIPILSKEGNILTDRREIIRRWGEHFSSVLNTTSIVDEELINNLPQRPILEGLSVAPPIAEVKKAIKQLTNGKSPGNDGIPAEIYKCGSNLLVTKLSELFSLVWESGSVPQEFKDASIIHLYKHKGKKCECDNHRGISLLCVAGKILGRIILNRLNDTLANLVLSESQCGFRSGRGTADMIFSLRQLQEKAREHDKELFVTFVDLTKAFDTVSRDALWVVLGKLGVPEKMLNVIISLHQGMMASVRSGGETSDTFRVSNGTKQGCVLAPLLFALYFSVMIETAFKGVEEGVQLVYRTSGGLFNQQRFKAKTKTLVQTVRDLLFADDCALVAHSLEDMQRILNKFSRASKAFGLTISIKKTELVHQPIRSHLPTVVPTVYVDGKALKTVSSFTYLGSIVSSDAKMDKEIESRIGKASSAFGRLYHRLWNTHDVSLRVKLNVYRSVVLTTLLYGAESWTLHRRHINQLDAFHMRCLRNITKVKLSDRNRNSEVLARCNMPGIEAILIKTQLRWSGHLIRMSDSRIPKQLLFGQFAKERPVGRPLLRFKDKLKDNLKRCNIPTTSLERKASERITWRHLCSSSVQEFEESRLQHRNQLRANVKARWQSSALPNPHFTCRCGFVARSKAGLAVHSRKHIANNVQMAEEDKSRTCSICHKICKSQAGLKRHKHVHKKY